MKAFMTGTTGHAGSVALNHFVEQGHEVHALVRPRHKGKLAERKGVRWVYGDFADSEIVREAVSQTDGVVHIGASHDAEQEQLDAMVIAAMTEGLGQSGKVFVSTSATPVYGDTGDEIRDEHEPIENPHPLRAWRMRHDLNIVGTSGIRGVIVRPGLIYGRAGGWLAGLILRAKESGVASYIGEGSYLVSTVHADALADLYLKAFLNEAAHGIYNAASDEVTCSRENAEMIAAHHGPGIEARSWPIEEAREALGELADLACVKCIVSSNRARHELGWHPIAPSVATELSTGSYKIGPLVPYGPG